MPHLVLLGDSIFDNGAYVAGGRDVISQLRGLLPSGWQASLGAIDGAVTRGVEAQLVRLPADATHLVVSAGGNDALGESPVLRSSVASVAEAVSLLEVAQHRFARDYDRMLDAVLGRRLPTAVATIYDTPPSAPDQRIIRTALAVFNDVITRAAFSRGLPLVDLRLICSEDGDYANPIEPSVQGGAKIAAAVASLAGAGDAAWRRPIVVAGS